MVGDTEYAYAGRVGNYSEIVDDKALSYIMSHRGEHDSKLDLSARSQHWYHIS